MSDAFLLIKALDPDAGIYFSNVTNKYYVRAHVEIGDGSTLSGITEHEDDTEDAIEAYAAALQAVPVLGDKFLVSYYRGQRREWQWNGAAFQECTREEVL